MPWVFIAPTHGYLGSVACLCLEWLSCSLDLHAPYSIVLLGPEAGLGVYLQLQQHLSRPEPCLRVSHATHLDSGGHPLDVGRES